MRFRPPGGLNPNQKSDRSAHEAPGPIAVGDKNVEESVYDRSRHEHEIERSESIASGADPAKPAAPLR